MRFAVETTGKLGSSDDALDEAALEAIFDQVAEALAELHELEADVAINLETAELEFYIVIEAHDSREAFAIACTVQDQAIAEANVAVEWNEAHARRAGLVPA